MTMALSSSVEQGREFERMGRQSARYIERTPSQSLGLVLQRRVSPDFCNFQILARMIQQVESRGDCCHDGRGEAVALSVRCLTGFDQILEGTEGRSDCRI
nr:hypothetical protein CFP56_74637 [Quercus suber]